jgi:hypothetical protein
MRLAFCSEAGYTLGTKNSDIIPTLGARVVFVNKHGVKEIGIADRLTFNYTLTYEGNQEDSVFVRLSDIQEYDAYIDEKRRERAAA